MCRKTDKKDLLKRSLLLQKDTVKLQKDLQKAVSEQTVLQEFGGLTEGAETGKERDAAAGKPDADSSSKGTASLSVSSAELQILLVKVKVALRTLSEILQKSRSMNGKLTCLRDAISSEGSENDAAVQERLQSLQVTGVLLAQIEAQAQTFAVAYGELEASLKDAGKAVDEARSIQMQNAIRQAVKLIREEYDS